MSDIEIILLSFAVTTFVWLCYAIYQLDKLEREIKKMKYQQAAQTLTMKKRK